MDRIRIRGGRDLSGSVRVSGSKNGALPILAASLMIDGPIVLRNMPRLKDVVTSNHSHLGVTALGRNVVVTCAIDNLVKGAAGGAVQWMNRLWSLPETTGLTAPAPAWT